MRGFLRGMLYAVYVLVFLSLLLWAVLYLRVFA